MGRLVQHGMTKHPYFQRWVDVMQRCYNENNAGYRHYGGRGIKVSKEFHNPKVFLEYIESLPGYGVAGMSIDRIKNNLGYQRGNIRFATRLEQTLNRRSYHNSAKSGVSFQKATGKYISYVYSNNKQVYLGAFNTHSEALKAKQDYVKKHNIKFYLPC